MPRIALKYVEVGMRLSKAVRNDAGMKLINKGTTITEKILQKLINANVGYVLVAGESDAQRLEEELSALDKRFARTCEKPQMDGLKRLLREHLEELYSC
jgi:hypothetical protein